MAKIEKTEAEWRAQLTPEQYRVAREKGTEAPFTGKYYDNHAEGVYRCIGCGAELFDSTVKYDSGCGWPSFYAATAEENIETEEDRTLGMHRTEIHCSQCGTHLGHLFPDGPRPTGLRYCVNSASIDFTEKT